MVKIWIGLLVLNACSEVDGVGMEPRDAGAVADVGSTGATDAETETPADAGREAPGDAGTIEAAPVGVIVVDVQELFVSIASTRNLDQVIGRQQSILRLAHERELPIFITYEDSTTGDHALHSRLAADVPPEAEQFVKTKFDATQLPAMRSAIVGSDRSHWLVVGTETDVCVMQTVLGLRSMGLGVLLASDAIFSSETNVSPALRRMQQAGVVLVDQTALEPMLADPPAPAGGAIRVMRPLEMGVLLNRFTGESIDRTGDPLASQKAARLHELLLVAEWFELPVFATDATVPPEYQGLFTGELRPIAEIASSGISQLAIAGTAEDLAAIAGIDRELYVVEDALLSAAPLDLLYDAGAVPTTYKSFYYEMTKSVDDREWPSQRWVDRAAIYWERTLAPEDLPPMPYSP